MSDSFQPPEVGDAPVTERVIELSVEVPGTPEEVWQAVATGPGITSWFVPHEVAEHEGGAVTMSFGPMGEESARVTAWEPPHRVVFTGGGERPLAYEWTVAATDEGTCLVRLANSGFGSGPEGDGDFEGMTQGWSIFLENLRLHLTYFSGQQARAFIPVGTAPGPNSAAFSALCAAFGVADDLLAGDRCTGRGEGIPTLSGTVEVARRERSLTCYVLVLDSPAPGTGFLAAEGEGDAVMVSSYLYFYGPKGAGLPDAWTALFAERFPMPAQ